MSIPYVANLAVTYEADHSFDEAGDSVGGVAGIMRSISLAAAGDEIHILNAADPTNNVKLDTLMKIPVASTANIAVNDLLVDTTASPNAALRVAVVADYQYVLGEYVAAGYGGTFANGDTVTTDGGATSTTIDDDPAYPGIEINADFAVNGTTTAPILIKGFAADGVTPQRVYLDGNATAEYGLSIRSRDYWQVSDLDIHDHKLSGVRAEAVGTCSGWRLERVTVRGADAGRSGQYGWVGMAYFRETSLIDCIVQDCAWSGVDTSPPSGTYLRCVFRNNGSSGIGGTINNINIVTCLIVDNAVDGLRISGENVLVTGCVIDGNGADGIELPWGAHDNTVIVANRITNNGGYGINASDAANETTYADYNAIYGNTSGSVNNVSLGANDHGAVGDTNIPTAANRDMTADGYTDADSDDYSLTASAVLRREACAIEDNAAYVTAGLTPDDFSVPAVGDVRSGTDYKDSALTGTLSLPAVGDVQVSVGYGAAGTEFTGTLALPTEAQVAQGVGYGADGIEFTGSMGTGASHDHSFTGPVHNLRSE